MFEKDPRKIALKKANLGHVGTIADPQNLHISVKGDDRYELEYEIPSSNPNGGNLKLKTDINASQVFILIQEGDIQTLP